MNAPSSAFANLGGFMKMISVQPARMSASYFFELFVFYPSALRIIFRPFTRMCSGKNRPLWRMLCFMPY